VEEPVKCDFGEQTSLWMSLSLDGLLEIDDQRQLQQHLAVCPVCQSEWQAMQQVSVLLESAEMVGPPLGFATRVERRLAVKTQRKKQAFGGLAVLTSSLSLAGVTIGAVVLIALGVLIWQWIGPQGASALSQVAAGVGLVGKGATFFLWELLVRYGPPLLVVVGIGLAVLVGIWTWLFVNRPGNTRRNGYA
jgi:predicted anti-sigma-YlaC factor YlaD